MSMTQTPSGRNVDWNAVQAAMAAVGSFAQDPNNVIDLQTGTYGPASSFPDMVASLNAAPLTAAEKAWHSAAPPISESAANPLIAANGMSLLTPSEQAAGMSPGYNPFTGTTDFRSPNMPGVTPWPMLDETNPASAYLLPQYAAAPPAGQQPAGQTVPIDQNPNEVPEGGTVPANWQALWNQSKNTPLPPTGPYNPANPFSGPGPAGAIPPPPPAGPNLPAPMRPATAYMAPKFKGMGTWGGSNSDLIRSLMG
jgi:hypothetical protein